MFNIVLLEPEKPANAGNIGRTCLLTNSKLHLIRPFYFKMDDKTLRRTGLDYWKDVDLEIYDNYEDFLEKNNHPNIYYATTKAKQSYSEVKFKDGDFIMFGKESAGIPEEILNSNKNNCIRIPMIKDLKRSLNLSNSVSIILFEALKQNNFLDLI
ncbi:tRNA (cytidine(34)-2'-O)-methyltransferase [Miniphocaeibacter halophilus]|uniref:tRNA (Cytidine(34)-2'-O)-methyltransferase n=1 Tax=Miniphocaeibacter halophilus TaxID=2931922 RepID=A0AC61N0V9_9FIRM|nr:tRNA (cytidine(34)-2'-O)-methyltransferase [Miniphocaeibacter halophilus]QQK07658.1 tRNA (cytidine(34)-2'-O)-methyltransferase [Miniphocaeibacter halophilus]